MSLRNHVTIYNIYAEVGQMLSYKLMYELVLHTCVLLATYHQCALILLDTSALYKLFIYLFTYFVLNFLLFSFIQGYQHSCHR